MRFTRRTITSVPRGVRTGPAIALASVLLTAAATGRAAAQHRGSLLIVGGGTQPDALVQRFVDLAGGAGHAVIAIVPLAGDEPQATGDEKADQLRRFGARAYTLPLSGDAPAAGAASSLDSATGIWFTGGDQSALASALAGTDIVAAIVRRYRVGAAIGGTSAGAAIMSDSMITGNQRRPDSVGYYGDEFPLIARGTIEIRPGFGLLPGAIVDQHFVRRERTNRLLSAVLERPRLLGVGIDEGTALEVAPDGRWWVRGQSVVVIYDARRATITDTTAPVLGARGVAVHILPPGSSFDPGHGTARLVAP
jgi:cyanophycinase